MTKNALAQMQESRARGTALTGATQPMDPRGGEWFHSSGPVSATGMHWLLSILLTEQRGSEVL